MQNLLFVTEAGRAFFGTGAAGRPACHVAQNQSAIMSLPG